LNAAPRIAPDPGAVAFLYRHGVPLGTTPTPVLTLHTTGDGGAVTDQERSYADRVRRHGDPAQLRQLYVERGGHCSNNAAEEIVTLRTLLTRVESGHWPATSPRRLTAAAKALGPDYRLVMDIGTFEEAPMAPAFTRFTPPRFLRPSL
jgi:hypothetical protein